MSADVVQPILPRERRRFLDWRFLVALCFLLVVVGAAWRGIEQSQEIKDKGHRIDTLIQTVQREQADADASQDAATLERDQLLDNQRAMLNRMRSMEREMRALRHWLNEQGIDLPAELRTPRADPKAPGSRAHARPRSKSKVSPRKTPTNPAGKPRGKSDTKRPPHANPPQQKPQQQATGLIEGLLGPLLDPIS